MSDSPLSASELAEIAKRAETVTPLADWRMERLRRDLEGVAKAEIMGWKADLTWDEVGALVLAIDDYREDVPRLVATIEARDVVEQALSNALTTANATLQRLAEPDEAVVEAAAESLWFSIDDGLTDEQVAPWADVDPNEKVVLRAQARAAIKAATAMAGEAR